MDLRTELKQLLEEIGPENIWRPVYDGGNGLLAEGRVDEKEASLSDLSQVDFQNKTVLDAGCSLGQYSFLVRNMGASRVLGVDIDPLVIRGADILKAMNNASGVDFRLADFTTDDIGGPFDIGLLISFFGKQMVLSGIGRFLSAIESLSRTAMVISIRPYYRIERHLGGDVRRLREHYPETYIRRDAFQLRDYVLDFFENRWQARQLTPETGDHGLKRTFLFVRK